VQGTYDIIAGVHSDPEEKLRHYKTHYHIIILIHHVERFRWIPFVIRVSFTNILYQYMKYVIMTTVLVAVTVMATQLTITMYI
jgi:hypothetical protein